MNNQQEQQPMKKEPLVFPFSFLEWYSGMSAETIERAWKRYQNEHLSTQVEQEQQREEIKKDIAKVRRAIALMNSMIACGENHSEVSSLAVSEAIQILDKMPIPATREWILCDDDMPELNTNVLVLINDRYYDVDRLFRSDTEECIYWDNYPDGGVTYWMPLPEPPIQ